MDKTYIDYENTDILDWPLDDSDYAECVLIGSVELPEPITERSKVELGEVKVKPKGNNSFWLYIGSQEGFVPHMHISRKKIRGDDQIAWDNAIVLELLQNHYFIHAKIWKNVDKTKWPRFKSDKEFETVIKFLKSPYSGEKPYKPNLTTWEQACYAWNDQNVKYPISPEKFAQGIPEYNYETITNYNEKESI